MNAEDAGQEGGREALIDELWRYATQNRVVQYLDGRPAKAIVPVDLLKRAARTLAALSPTLEERDG